ncbi:Outer membrane receptor proteins, mostly Fe transport [Reichenbachiella agariperforans]|uniref:Outer membrane receptor proteins, mostly Fe transport n=1 Tax=Reichenbachiella agariperforans TaxID=156994 RepID=A0A1M6JQZ4_REIAG|nr:TonB-dependent receptor [Reichenbachiella agariperforans]SHJ49086.1 Outer membrane receptor proteins, mostly Fe transport [Reichenbachiella agariperforans]
MKILILSITLILVSFLANAQEYYISGVVTNEQGENIPGVNVIIKGSTNGVSTDAEGKFKVKIPGGKRILLFRGVGLKTQEMLVDHSFRSKQVNIQMEDSATELDAIQVVAESESFLVEKKGFSVDAIETQKIKSQSLEINNVLGRTAGVRVRKSGGVGADFNYSLDGLSGNAIRFFIDGVPMDYFGSSYSINNIPITLIERIDIYKGVVPVALGSDALGGAINLVTNQEVSNYVSASYSFGSFNTHQATLNGQWRTDSGLTTRLSTFYTYSDNNYKVWGEGVFYGDEDTGKAIYFTEDDPAERFNDDFQTATVKFDVGFTQKQWADQLFVSILTSDQKKGVQTGQTMGHVYGEMRNNEQVLMPSITYQKKDLFTNGLDVNAFAGYSYIEGTTVDTTTNRYDWRGKVIGNNPSGGEIGRGGSKSLFTIKDKSYIMRFNTTYQLPLGFRLGFNYLYTSTNRTGNDPFSPSYRIPYLEPQKIGSHFAGLSLETSKFNDKLHANVFLKKYAFKSTINDLVYTTEYEIIEHKNDISNWGGGFAASYLIQPNLLIKSSIEQATRLPSATEALGDGVTIENNPSIRPEQTFNANIGAVLGRYELGARHGVKIAVSTFYRDVTDKLKLLVEGGQEQGQYENINKVKGSGAEIDIVYDFDQKLKLNLNGTYLNFRNNQKTDEHGRENIVYGDRLRNDPYLMANAGLEYNVMNLIQKNSRFFAYLQSSYVHEFFLNWPSLGSRNNKSIIPSQLVCDAGVGYTFPSEKVTLALDVSNLFNEQVYDNFLLQKPGRAFFLKINYQIIK